MQMIKNKTMAIIITMILVISMAISIGSLQTTKAYGSATQTAITQGMYWTGMTGDASATRLLLWNRFNDTIPTHVYIITAPTPIGIGQRCNIVFFNPQLPESASGTDGNSPRYTYTFQVTKPDGTVQNFPTSTPPSYSSWSQNSIQQINGQYVFQSDSTGSSYMSYIPDQLGNYTFTVNFVQFQYLWNGTTYSANGRTYTGGSSNYYGVVYKGSTYTTTLVVQQDEVSLTGLTVPSYDPVPTEYWARPINQENQNWWTIGSNWLGNSNDFNNGGGQNAFQADGTAPNTGHILWTVPEEDSGILGGSNTGGNANSFNTGSQYQPRLTPPTYGGMGPIIMYGRLYYSPSIYYTGYSELFNAIDLKTGQFLYQVNTTAVTGARNLPAFGYYYDQEDINEHGIQNPGWLFTSTFSVGYQPGFGYAELHLSNVATFSGGSQTRGANGESLGYAIVSNTTHSFLTQWNSSRVIPMISSGAAPNTNKYIGNVPLTPARTGSDVWNGSMWGPSSATNFTGLQLNSATNPSYDFNVSLTYNGQPFHVTSATVGASKAGDIVWCYNASWPTGTSAPSYAYNQNVTVWAVNINPTSADFGKVLYVSTIDTELNPTSADSITGNQNLLFEHADVNEGVFVAITVPAQQYYVFNMRTGAKLFTTDPQSQTLSPFGYYTWPSLISGSQVKTAYGMLYTGGYSGTISAYALNSTGDSVAPVWRYAVIPSGTAGTIKSSPGMLAGIADGKLYIGAHEHSALTPLESGNDMKCLNATDGTLIWQMSGWVYPSTFAVADGVMTYLNNYDEQIYGVGKGPTQMTLQAPDAGIPLGNSVTIKGTVTDISAGTKQTAQAANFPNGVPAVSDASMSQWMEYVYMQKSQPTNATGVPVTLSVVDANGNFREIGSTVSNDGFFSLNWKPDITGQYTVYASFAGSESYYSSHAVSAFSVDAVAPTPAPQPVAALPPLDTYIFAGVAAMIIAIAIVGVVILIAVRKRP